MSLGGWRSKLPSTTNGTAHYILPDGSVSCSDERSGCMFSGQWGPLDANHHLCRLCRDWHGGTCRCGSCTAQVEP